MRSIAVMTSGGDSPGMNAGIRSVVRAALTKGWKVWLIEDGWEGLIDGRLRLAKWSDVSHILQLGGTILGTARSDRFRKLEGRREACRQLASKDVDGLVCIGGDGSLTGANFLRTEWADHKKALGLDEGGTLPHLDVVGMVGSIDNDLAGFTQTIGADSALHRIISAVDSIVSTALSHGRTFVIEVMGRSSGYLALAAAMICGADWVFIPERPDGDDWKEKMCRQILAGREMHRRKSIILLAEGAVTTSGERITSEQVKNAIEKVRFRWVCLCSRLFFP
jgi:6-phosphofructokinase 1